MEKKSSTTQNRRRKKEKEVSDSVLEKSSMEEHDGESTPLASSTPATKRRGRPPQGTTKSPNTPQTKSMLALLLVYTYVCKLIYQLPVEVYLKFIR